MINMPHDDDYKDAIKKLNEFRLSNKFIFDQINASGKAFSDLNLNAKIPKIMDEFARINSMQEELSKTRSLFNSPIFDLARQASFSISQISAFSHISKMAKEATRLSELLKERLCPFNGSEIALQAHFSKVSQFSLLAQQSFSRIPFQDIGRLIDLSEGDRNSFQRIHLEFSESYSRLFSSFEQDTLKVISLPPLTTYLPPVEFYTGSRVIRTITTPEVDVQPDEAGILIELTKETNDIVVSYIDRINPSLAKLWQGANQALKSENPDSVRHFITSLRELLTHVIHSLSPDDQLRTWSSAPEHYHNNKPTRRARLLYICREVNYEPFDHFLNKDIESVLACFELFQQGTHEVEPFFSPSQLEAIKLRAESAIRLLVELGKKTSST